MVQHQKHFNSPLLPPIGKIMQSTQTLFKAPITFKGDLLYFKCYHRHHCLYANYQLSSQYFCDNMNDCKTEYCGWKYFCEAVSYLHGNCLLSLSAAAQTSGGSSGEARRHSLPKILRWKWEEDNDSMLIKFTIHFSSCLKMCIFACNFTAVISQHATEVGKCRFSIAKCECAESADVITTAKW